MSDSFYGQSNDDHDQAPDSKNPPHTRNNRAGLLEHKDVASRRTRLFIDSAAQARQDITQSRKILFIACLSSGLLIVAAPFLATIVADYIFYNDSQIVWAVRRVSHELWVVFALPGLLLVACSIMLMAKKIPIARFNLTNQTIHLKEQRFQAIAGWSRKPAAEVIPLAELEGLEIISYKAKQLQYRNKAVDQFELTLLLNNGERRLIAKQPGTNHCCSMLPD